MSLFQSTHLHEVRRLWHGVHECLECFNPRTYMRCDSKRNHPAWGCGCFNPRTYMRCDRKNCKDTKRNLRFNPRTYMRCDLSIPVFKGGDKEFQSTHLHEVRPLFSHASALSLMFQSTHLHEVRLLRARLEPWQPWFQSTHLHEVRRRQRTLDWLSSCFNPRTYMRCDDSHQRKHDDIEVSIHAPT